MIIPIKSSILNYQIVLEKDILYKAKEYLNLNCKVLIISDDNIPNTYLEIIKKQCLNPFVYLITAGEKSKNITNYQKIISFMMSHHFSRKDAIVALGGGVVGDLSGFISATYMRGITFYNIPTSLLAQVDSSIGGKTAIDFHNYKNIIGAFKPANMVLIDPNTLKTLDIRQLHAGLVEVIKMALTCDSSLFEIIEKSEDLFYDIDFIIYKALLIKKNIVEQDEKENNIRKVLNFGHTIGHAIESYFDMTLLHGECVGLGMLYMMPNDLKERVIKILKKYNLPTTIDFDIDKLLKLIYLDKKSIDNKIDIVFVKEIGTYEIRNIKISDLKNYLKGEIPS